MTPHMLTRSLDRGATIFLLVVVALRVLIPLSNLLLPEGSFLQVPAASAISSIQSSLAVWSTVQNAWYGLSLGSVLLLAAIGLAITFGVMGVINMAHGEMVMLGPTPPSRCRR